jgi:hypothetical protein
MAKAIVESNNEYPDTIENEEEYSPQRRKRRRRKEKALH